ncbi:MAG: hypothetical protein DRP85_01215 [Candidatus Makaraimicrobium thalassicum]|nr:MAG: hypothetical protein DRP85_01215 [Candidatus Omnitrophota bacterium]
MADSFKTSRGITLVEVVMAVALTAIVVVSLGASMTQSSVFSMRIERVYTASYLAQRRIDMLKRLRFDELSGAAETDIRIGADGNIDSNGDYTRTTEITTNFDGNPYLTKIKVTVNKVRINIDGTIRDPGTGEITYMGQPIVMETLFADID